MILTKLVVFASEESMFIGLPGPPELSIYLDHVMKMSVENYVDFHEWGIRLMSQYNGKCAALG